MSYESIAKKVGVEPFARNAFYTYSLGGQDQLTCWLDTPIRFRIPDYRIQNPDRYRERTSSPVVCDTCECRPICIRCEHEQQGDERETYCRPDTPHNYGEGKR